MYYGNNSRQSVNVNTNFMLSYSDTAMLLVGGWNTQLSVKLKPCVGKDANGIRQYAEDKSQIISTSITADNATCLVNGFNKEVLPALNGDKESGSVSIVMGSADQRKILTVGYTNGNAYISISGGLDETGKASGTITHIFNKKQYLSNYDPSVGNAIENNVESELLNFITLVCGVSDLAPVTAHSIRYDEANRAAFTNNRANNGFGQQNVGATNNYQAPTSNVSMDDLPFLS